jgi:glycosyltransferase involved in cell wall biosynthesis
LNTGGNVMSEPDLHIGVDGRELLGRPTGVGRYLHEVLRLWAEDASFPHRVTVIVPAAPPAELAASLPRVGWLVAASPSAGTWWEQTHLPRAIARSGLDVFFAAGYTAPLRLRVPFVVAIYDVSFFAHPGWFRRPEGFRRRRLTASAARRADRVITISEFSASEIVRWIGIDRNRILLAPPGAPPVVAHEGRSRAPVVLFVGSLFTRRHVPELLQAFTKARVQIPTARLVLAGDNRTAPRVDPLALAADLGVAGAVEWREYVSDDALDALYREARVFAFLSDYEGFGMTPLEALARGVPPVLLDTPVMREVYGDGARFVRLEVAEIAAALVDLLSDDRSHDALLAAGLRQLGRFSWPRSAATIRRALEDAASSRARRGHARPS